MTAHPNWCDPSRCDVDQQRGVVSDIYHWGTAAKTRVGDLEAMVELVRIDNVDHTRTSDPTSLYLHVIGEGSLTLEQFEALAEWITARAGDLRTQIETEAR